MHSEIKDGDDLLLNVHLKVRTDHVSLRRLTRSQEYVKLELAGVNNECIRFSTIAVERDFHQDDFPIVATRPEVYLITLKNEGGARKLYEVLLRCGASAAKP
jgi:hypothetical protein